MGPFGFVAAVIPADLQCGILGCVALLVVLCVVDWRCGDRRPVAEAFTGRRRRRKGVRR